MRRQPPLLAIAAVLGIGIPGLTLLVFWLAGWELPTWLTILLPVILIGSTRGTAILLLWKAGRWLGPRIRSMLHRESNSKELD